MASVRRSGRQRQTPTKYGKGILEGDSSRFLRASSESSQLSSQESLPEAAKSDQEFDTTKLDDPERISEDDDDLSMGSGSGRDYSDYSDLVPNEADIDHDGPLKRRQRLLGNMRKHTVDKHVRGVALVGKSSAREFHWAILGGPDDEDLIHLTAVRDLWSFKRDIAFPSRKTLALVSEQGLYGIVSRPGVSEDDMRAEASESWRWYDDEVGGLFRERQTMNNIDESRARKYRAYTTGLQSKFVMGPYGGQSLHQIDRDGAIDLGIAWKSKSLEPEVDTEILQDKNRSDLTIAHSDQLRYGWLLNLGNRIQCLSWAPNRQRSLTQYLALSTVCTSSQREAVSDLTDNKGAAFRPSPKYPSSIQIWAFRSKLTLENLQVPDMDSTPTLSQVICMDFGTIRQVQWCPALRETQTDLEGRHSQEKTINLGLLALLCSDSHVRVLDIVISPPEQANPQFVHLKSAPFDASTPSTVYTCLSFASPTDLLCGTADGRVDLFSILPKTLQARDESPSPYLSTQQSSTYLLTIVPASPSPHPHLICSLSMSTTPVLVDLRAPETDRVQGRPTRLSTKVLNYSPQTRCFLSVSAEGDDIIVYPVRSFYHTSRLWSIPGQGSITALATSRWHPCALIGTSGGAVASTNMVRGILPSIRKNGGKASECWVQKLCEHQWIPDPDSASTETNPTTQKVPEDKATKDVPPPETIRSSPAYHIPDARPGISRFYEPFKPERQTHPPASSTHRKASSGTKPPAGGSAQDLGAETIYPEEQAVTAAEWNPNIACAGWIAVAWGSGILRVEDVAHDAG